MIQPNQATAGTATSVARRSPDGWQYVIRLDLSSAVLDGSLRPEVASPSDAVRRCLT
jgi:hypothetical protein